MTLARVGTLRVALAEEQAREEQADATLRAMWADARDEFYAARQAKAAQMGRVRAAWVAGQIDSECHADLLKTFRAEIEFLDGQFAALEVQLQRWMVRARIVRPEDFEMVAAVLRMINDGEVRPRRYSQNIDFGTNYDRHLQAVEAGAIAVAAEVARWVECHAVTHA